MATKIEQLIDEMADYLDECKAIPLSQSKIIVSKDVIFDYLNQLKLRTPDEVKRYQKIISNRDQIIKEAEDKAADIIKAAEEKAEALVNESDIVQQAFARANEMVAEAGQQADNMREAADAEAQQMKAEAENYSNTIRNGALSYANEVLAEIENSLANAYESAKAKSDLLTESLKANLETIVANRRELNGEVAPAQKLTEAQLESFERDAQLTHANIDDLNLDGDLFLNNVQ